MRLRRASALARPFAKHLQDRAARADAVIYLTRCICCIHSLILAIYVVNAVTKHIGPMFCSTSLLHRGAIYDSFLAQLRPTIDDLIEITDVPASAQDVEFMEALIKLMLFERGVRDLASARVGGDVEAAVDTLRQFYVRYGRLCHHCSFGCCRGGKRVGWQVYGRHYHPSLLIATRDPSIK